MKTLDLLHKLSALLPWAGLILLACVLTALLSRLVLSIKNWRRLLRRKFVFLELTPPALTERTALATQELFSVIHGQRASRSWQDKLLRRAVTLTPEITSTRSDGIRYIIQVERRIAATVTQIITSYLPDAKVAETEDFLPSSDKTQIIEFKQTGHYAFSLAPHFSLEQHDPVAFLTGAMTKLAADEQIRVQFVLTPVRPREADLLARKILGNEDLLSHLNGRKVPLFSTFTNLVSKALFGVTDTVGEVYHGSTHQSYQTSQRSAHEQLQVARRLRPARTLSAFELELMESMHRKLNQPLFRVSVRVAVTMDDEQAAKERLSAIKSSLQSYSVPSYQSLQPKIKLPFLNSYRCFVFEHRLPSLFASRDSVLSTSEIASLYHFPLNEGSKTDNLVTSLSPTLPAPISLKQNKELEVLIGVNEHHGISTPIGLTTAERQRHVYMIGGTGNGKTTVFEYKIVQDIHGNKGVAVIDPHGDMAEKLLRYIPENRIKDVIYFNPDDLAYPIGLNILELTPGLTGDELLREKELITESVVSIFRKIFSDDDSGGHRIEYVLRNAIQTALTVKDATLFTIYDLLNDPKFRKSVIKTLENKDLVNFWKNELGKAGDMQKVKMAAGITAKLGRFLFSASAKRIIEQPKSTIDFDEIINSGKILICNVSKGLLGEDNSELFGILILAMTQLASLRRARLPQSERREFYLYVDEFQNFATDAFVQMLSESRKYKLFITMAEQSTSQQKDQQMVNVILANVGTVICFRTGNPNDERYLLPLFSPYVQEGEIANLAPFNFYIRLAAVKSQEPTSGRTILLDNQGNEKVAAKAIAMSRKKYATRVKADDKVAQEPTTKRTANKQSPSNKMLDE